MISDKHCGGTTSPLHVNLKVLVHICVANISHGLALILIMSVTESDIHSIE